jgi:hypothetical protein
LPDARTVGPVRTWVFDDSGSPVHNASVIVEWQLSGRSEENGTVSFMAPLEQDYLMIVYQDGFAPFIFRPRASDRGRIFNITLVEFTHQVEFYGSISDSFMSVGNGSLKTSEGTPYLDKAIAYYVQISFIDDGTLAYPMGY